MAQKKAFDADALLLHPPRIIAPDGSNAILIDYTEDDLLGVLRVLQEVQDLPQAQIPLKLADALLGLCVDPEAGARCIDALPLPRLMDVIIWLQTAEEPTFIVSGEPDGEVRIGGQAHAVRLLTVGTFRRIAALTAEPAPTGDVFSLVRSNDTVMAGMIDNMTPDEWRRLPRRISAAVERYINGLMREEREEADPKAPVAENVALATSSQD